MTVAIALTQRIQNNHTLRDRIFSGLIETTLIFVTRCIGFVIFSVVTNSDTPRALQHFRLL
ncbi:hypothetical protein H6G81_05015 [Scytonema hofmannii FACHB-248]|uniref:Uncharacterized protein n=1 Tax=Scytonema hofmannii FACHB-248 TaxID=1842502 RepID=A0ABR8GLJ1_9CYAN|nr:MULTISPECIES: hypothetical protein [Nostocales]MBD2603909.1 hypothetical protein [Scytonema hofmannii FACHB-248]